MSFEVSAMRVATVQRQEALLLVLLLRSAARSAEAVEQR